MDDQIIWSQKWCSIGAPSKSSHSCTWTMHHGSTWSGSTIYMENPLPEEATWDIGLWSMLCQLPTITPRGEFSGSSLHSLEGMGCCTSVLWHLRMSVPQGLPKEEWNVGMVVTLLMACTHFWDGTDSMTCSAQTDYCLQYTFLCINPFRSYIGPRPTLWFSHSAPMSGDIRHFFFCAFVRPLHCRNLFDTFFAFVRPFHCRSLSDTFPHVVQTLANK